MSDNRSQNEKVLLYAMLTSLTALSIDALLPALRIIGEELPIAYPLTTQHIVSIFIFGMGLGELFAGPLADAFGRKPTVTLGLALFAVGTAIAMSAGSVDTIIFGRFLQGLGVSGPKIATRAMIRDQFGGDDMARIISLMFSLLILVPMIAPSLAQGLMALAGWRNLFTAYLFIAAVMGMWFFARHGETLPISKRVPFRWKILLRNSGRILSSRRVSLTILATGLIFGAQLVYLSSAADLFFDTYGIDEEFPFYFACLATSIGLASFLNAKLVRRFRMETMAYFAILALSGTGFLMLCAIWALPQALPLPILLSFCFCAFFSIGILFGNLNAIAMRSLSEMAGLGASLIASGSSLIASLFAMSLGSFDDGTPLTLAFGFFVAGCVSHLLFRCVQTDASGTIEAIR